MSIIVLYEYIVLYENIYVLYEYKVTYEYIVDDLSSTYHKFNFSTQINSPVCATDAENISFFTVIYSVFGVYMIYTRINWSYLYSKLN